MTDAGHDDRPSTIVDLIDDAVVPDANAEGAYARQLLRARWTGIVDEGDQTLSDAIEERGTETLEITLRRALDLNAIRGHAWDALLASEHAGSRRAVDSL